MNKLAEDLGIETVFTGELTDPRPAYAAMDIFVLPSAQPEPFGGVVMEAMALGLPVVGTAIGGTSEQIAEGETGLLVPPADAEALAEALARLVTSDASRHAMGQAARQRVAQHFLLDRMVSRIEVLYADLAK